MISGNKQTQGISWYGIELVGPDYSMAHMGKLDILRGLTLKHRETHGCVVSTVATDALVLKHQAISILSTD